MNYITIISKEEIKYLPNWIFFVVFTSILLIVIVPTIISHIIVKKLNKNWMIIVNTELISGAIALIGVIIFSFGISPELTEPSGKYKYKASIDKDNITVSQYEGFIEKYHPEIKDGYYYFEYGELE